MAGSQTVVAGGGAEPCGATYTCQYSGVESGIDRARRAAGTGPAGVRRQRPGRRWRCRWRRREVAPGRGAEASGTATFTFGANATATNASTVFTFLSDSFGVDVADGGQQRFLRIAELKTTRSTPTLPW